MITQPSDGAHPTEVRLQVEDGYLTVTNRGVRLDRDERLVFELLFRGLRRIQLDIEQDRPATFVLVPHRAAHPPQVLSISPEHYGAAGTAISIIGRRLAELGPNVS